MLTVGDIGRFAVSRLFSPVALAVAIEKLGYVQADPIRAPARAQDLTLRHRVNGYRAGDLERSYAGLPVEEDVFINYGFVSRSLQALMHPRTRLGVPAKATNARVRALLEFVRERGDVYPRDVDAHFSHGTVTNYWGGSSSATTYLLEAMHYNGLLRVARRDAGIRIYGVKEHTPGPSHATGRRERLDALVDMVVRQYAPVPASSLSFVVRRLRYAVPQWRTEIAEALERAKQRLSRATVEGATWYWPADEPLIKDAAPDTVRLLAPFDPLVWDRRRFGLLWGWAYRFEAYTPLSKRKLGYYALPLLWRDRVIGWGNVSVVSGQLRVEIGYVSGSAPHDRRFRTALDSERTLLREFLGG